MKRTRHTPEQIIRKLKTADQLIAQGKTVADLCRVLEVAQPTYSWALVAQATGSERRASGEGSDPGDVREPGTTAECQPACPT